MWKHRILYLAVFAAALISYLASDRREALALLVVLLLLPVLAAVLQLFAMRSLKLSCRMRRVSRVGQPTSIDWDLQRADRIPLGAVRVQVTFENLLFQEKWVKEFLLLTSDRKEMYFQHTFVPEDCGTVRVLARRMDCCDLLGLFHWRRAVSVEEEITVYPSQLQLNTGLLRRPQSKNVGEKYDPYKKGQDVSEVSGLRDYVSGDSLKSIHWKLSGKMDRLIVREFGYPSNYHTLIVYDAMKRIGPAAISNRCNNAVLALTVTLSYNLMRMNLEHNVGRVHIGEIKTVPVNSRSSHEQMVVNLLAVPIQEEGTGEDVASLFLQGNFRSAYTKVIYITPSYDEQTLRRLSREVDLTLIHVYEGENLKYLSATDYTIIPVNADTYREKVHNIAI